MEIIKNPITLNHYLSLESYRFYFPKKIDRYAILCEFSSGENVFTHYEEPEYLFFMVKGRCRIHTYLSNGKSITLNTIKAPCLIGEMELLGDMSSRFDVTALETCRMIAFHLEKSRDILGNDASFLKKVCIDIRHKEQLNALRLIHAFGFPLEIRLAQFILENRQGKTFQMKKVDIAESLGTSYRHLETVMDSFVKKKYLSKDKFIYTITNEKALKDMASQLE